MARSVIVDGRQLLVDGEPFPLVGGEIHYWRHDPGEWAALVAAAADLGLAYVATYLPWQFHEVAEGVFDFRGVRGDPRRDVERFIDLVAARGLRLFARPGPYIYAEWRNQGVPDRVATRCKCDPAYLAAAGQWLEAAAGVLRPRLATNGGPIILVQADNESDPAPHLHAEALGLGTSPGPFQHWLVRRYGSVGALNTAWGVRLEAFEQARAVLVPGIPGRHRAFLDACDFRLDLAADHVRFAADVLRRAGVDVPLVTNTWPGHDAQDWWTFSRIGDVHGIDPYPANLYRGFAGEHRYHRERFRYLRALGRLPFIAEFGAGVWTGQETVTGVFAAEHYRLAALTALSEGVAGWNWYMLADRDRWLMAPLDHHGAAKPALAPTFAAMARVFRGLGPGGRRVRTSFAAAWSPRHRQVAQIETGRDDDEVLEALHGLGCAFDFVDVDRDEAAQPKILFYTGPSWLSRAGQEGLRRYVERGGVLVFHRSLPVRGEDLEPLNLLDLPLPDGTGHPGQRAVAVTFEGRTVLAGGPAHLYEWPPGEPITAHEKVVTPDEASPVQWSLVGRATFLCGCRIRRGSGEIIILGCAPSRDLLLAVLAETDARPPCLPETPGVQAALLDGQAGVAMVVVNPTDAALDVRLRLAAPGIVHDGTLRLVDLETGAVDARVVANGVLELPVPGRGGRALVLQRS